MICRRCGYENEPDFRYCENCGLDLSAPPKKAADDDLHIPSIFEEPVRYEGKYSDIAKAPRRKRHLGLRITKKGAGILASLLILFLIWVFASQYGRVNDEMPPIIQEYADAVRARDTEQLQQILLSSVTLLPPNPKSIDGFLRAMEIPGRLNESVRNLEVDLSHLMQDPAYVSNLPVKLLRTEVDGEEGYRIGVETYTIDVGDTGATVDGYLSDENGLFPDFLMGQYTVEYGMNRYPLLLDSTNPDVVEGTIVPPQIAADRQSVTEESTNTQTPVSEGSLRITVETDAQNGKLRRNGEDTSIPVGNGPLQVNPGDTIQIVDLWRGGIGLSDEVRVTQEGHFAMPIRYDTEELRETVYQRIRAMLIEDAMMLHEKNADGFTTLVDPALEKAKDNVAKLIAGNQNYAGTYDRVAFDPESFTFRKQGDQATIRVLGLTTYVYQTYTIGTPEIDIDTLWRDDAVMAYELVLDEDTSEWMIADWGRTEDTLSDAVPVTVEIIE